jgi:S-DNA-T family DNA segregation ATPase FtsK/SpoIIIE
MLTAGWLAHKLNAPGKFLISAPEHDTPRRARAYLLTDQAVSDTASRHAQSRPVLDDVSRRAVDERPGTSPGAPATRHDAEHDGTPGPAQIDAGRAPDAILWAVLCLAPDEGVTVPELMDETGMSRPWVYQRLQDLVRNRQVIQVSRGRWRAIPDGQPPAPPAEGGEDD